MKLIAVVVFYVVTWNEWIASYHDGTCNKPGCLVSHWSGCSLDAPEQSQRFDDAKAAKQFVKENEGDKKKFDFKIKRVEEEAVR